MILRDTIDLSRMRPGRPQQGTCIVGSLCADSDAPNTRRYGKEKSTIMTFQSRAVLNKSNSFLAQIKT